jgi:hypothetical protein
LVERRDPPLEVAPERRHRHQGIPQRRRDARGRWIDQDRSQLADVLRLLGDHQAELRHQAAQLVDHHVRCLMSSVRSLCSPAAACWASLLTATKRIDGRLTASQIAAASAASLLRRT